MKRVARRQLSVFLITVFINFVFVNTVFVHTHLLYDGTTVTHSHPYLPAAQHQHSADSLGAIAMFNAAASAIESTAPMHIAPATGTWLTINVADRCIPLLDLVHRMHLRGPPALG